jgi:hypothetical protein
MANFMSLLVVQQATHNPPALRDEASKRLAERKSWPVWLGWLEDVRLANLQIPTDLQPADQE